MAQFDDRQDERKRGTRQSADPRLDNKLTIRSPGLSVELGGRANSIRRAYRSLRPQLVEQFYETMNEKRRPQDRTLKLPITSIMDEVDSNAGSGETSGEIQARSESKESDKGDDYLNLIICEDAYRKMFLLDEKRFKQSFLGSVLRVAPLGRLYVNGDVEARVRDKVDVGATLWRELTPAGKAAMGRSD